MRSNNQGSSPSALFSAGKSRRPLLGAMIMFLLCRNRVGLVKIFSSFLLWIRIRVHVFDTPQIFGEFLLIGWSIQLSGNPMDKKCVQSSCAHRFPTVFFPYDFFHRQFMSLIKTIATCVPIIKVHSHELDSRQVKSSRPRLGAIIIFLLCRESVDANFARRFQKLLEGIAPASVRALKACSCKAMWDRALKACLCKACPCKVGLSPPAVFFPYNLSHRQFRS